MQIAPYLGFNGQCQEAFKFYEQCLGGQIVAMIPHRGTPAAEHVPPDQQDRILHARLAAGDAVLMGSDYPAGEFAAPKGISVSLQVEDAAAAERVFHALAEGGTVQMPIQETFFAARFGMLTDRFGIPWMVNCEKAA